MLEPWIIEQIRRREEEERRIERERPRLELPLSDIPRGPDRERDKKENEDGEEDDEREPKRGVVIIGL